MELKGNLESIRESLLAEMEGLYALELERHEMLPLELAEKLAYYTSKINREMAVYVDRKGQIASISIGDSATVTLPEVEGRRDTSRLSGIRCIHTHPNGDGMLSSVDMNSLRKLRLDAMIAIGVSEGAVTDIYAGVPDKNAEQGFGGARVYGPFRIGDGRMNYLFEVIVEQDRVEETALYHNEKEEERAILIGLETYAGRLINGKSEGQRSLEELAELAETAGATVVQSVLQRKGAQDAAYYVGKGKIEEISLMRQALNANVLIFDDELSGAQVRNIEELAGAKVVDRTALILDIFAQRARSSEGKLQVELAQLKYRLPRLIGLGNQLSRLGGGIGTRGPGEKKLEVDRRHINRRIAYLNNELENIEKRRGVMREGRKKNMVPTLALVGYTNAGKSTLMNTLCHTDVFAENKLFATLDPTTRKLALPGGREVLLIDTVGFIRKLPHDLVEAFKSTLEEAVHADVLLHVVDASNPEAEAQVAVVYDLLQSLGALNKPVLTVLNKMDQVSDEFLTPSIGPRDHVYEVSAVTGAGLDRLLQGIQEIVQEEEEEIELIAPYNEGWLIPYLYQHGKVTGEEYTEEGVRIKAVLRKDRMERVRGFEAEKEKGE